jgi:hypothetical protein
MTKNKDIIENNESSIPEGYLTLREASELTEYTSDYIGQLIRAGKIEGKQIYSNVAWVASARSLKEYLEKRGKDMTHVESHAGLSVIPREYPTFLRTLMYVVIATSGLFLVMLFHILSISIDRAMARNDVHTPATPIEINSDGTVVPRGLEASK